MVLRVRRSGPVGLVGLDGILGFVGLVGLGGPPGLLGLTRLTRPQSRQGAPCRPPSNPAPPPHAFPPLPFTSPSCSFSSSLSSPSSCSSSSLSSCSSSASASFSSSVHSRLVVVVVVALFSEGARTQPSGPIAARMQVVKQACEIGLEGETLGKTRSSQRVRVNARIGGPRGAQKINFVWSWGADFPEGADKSRNS